MWAAREIISNMGFCVGSPPKAGIKKLAPEFKLMIPQGSTTKTSVINTKAKNKFTGIERRITNGPVCKAPGTFITVLTGFFIVNKPAGYPASF